MLSEPRADRDMKLLAWARRYMDPQAINTAPTIVGPGHDGASAGGFGHRPEGVDERQADFRRAMEVYARLHHPYLRQRSMIVQRAKDCEHCHDREPWKAVNPPKQDPVSRMVFHPRDQYGRDNPTIEVLPEQVPVVRQALPATLSDVLWMAHGLHGEATAMPTICAHVAWQFASDAHRVRWAGFRGVSVRHAAMSGFGSVLLAIAARLYQDLGQYQEAYNDLTKLLTRLV